MGSRGGVALRPAALAALALLLISASLPAGVLEGRVVAVQDGDDLVVQVGKAEREIRISGIDAPEHDQPWGDEARKALTKRVLGKPVRINEVTTDRYGRTVGEVYADNVCVGCELVREGHAWVYRRYNEDPVLLSLEEEARAAERGLWSLPESERMPPWQWRHGGGSGTPPRADDGSGRRGFRCGARTYCREMTSCAEARFHLEQCGLTRIDGDGDGVPCEKLCRG